MTRGTTARAGAGEGAPTPDVLALPHTNWLYHHLRVAGAPAEVAAFRAATAGAGVIPWKHDLGPAAEDWFHLLAMPPAPQRRSLSLEGCRILAGQLRDAAEARQWRVAEQSPAAPTRSTCTGYCPHPSACCGWGPDQPETLAWLWVHWGMRRLLVVTPQGAALKAFLPPAEGQGPIARLQRRAAPASTLVAGLELSRDGTAVLDQDAAFGGIVVRSGVAGGAPAAQDAAA